MGIFSSRPAAQAPVMESFSFTEEQLSKVDTSLTGMNEILTESAEDFYKIEAGMYISDVMIESQVTLENAAAEPLLENFVKSAWERIKEAFKALWKKIKGWYEAAIRWFRLAFAGGDTLVKKFKKEIESKSIGEFEYEGHDFDIAGGDSAVNKVANDGKSYMAKELGVLTSGTAADYAKQAGSDEDSSDMKEKMVQSVFGGSIADTVDKVRETFYGKDGKETIEKFSAASPSTMLKFIEDKSKTLKAAEEAGKEVDAEFKKAYTAIERAESVISGDKGLTDAEKTRKTAYASARVKVIKDCLGGVQSVRAVQINAIKDAYKEYVRVLRSFLSYKPAKESVGIDGEDQVDSTSILESAMRWV